MIDVDSQFLELPALYLRLPITEEEMNAIEGQEVLLPVVLPRELWEESGRYNSIGSELFKIHIVYFTIFIFNLI